MTLATIFVRFPLISVSIIESCRLLPLLYILFASALQNGNVFLRKLVKQAEANTSNVRLLREMQDSVKFYQTHGIICAMLAPFQECCTAVQFAGKFTVSSIICKKVTVLFLRDAVGLLSSIIFISATLRTYNVLPFLFYMFFPSAAVIVIIVIALMIPIAQGVNDMSKKFIRVWLAKIRVCEARGTRNFLRRVVRSLRPQALYVGIFGFRLFAITRSNKVTYYDAIMMYTMNTMMGVPQKIFENMFHA